MSQPVSNSHSQDVYDVIIVDDHKIVRQGYAEILAQHDDLQLVGEFKNGERALEYVKFKRPDLVVCESVLPDMNGLDLIQKGVTSVEGVNFLLYTQNSKKQCIMEGLEKGVKGIVLKDSEDEDIVAASRCVARGEQYFDRRVSAMLARHITLKNSSEHVVLTQRETQILCLIVDGYTTRDIAESIFVSIRTVDAHRRRIMEKMGARNIADMVRIAILNGIYQPHENSL